LGAGQSAHLRITLLNDAGAAEQHPAHGIWRLPAPSDEAAAVWSA
jgi:hypothetical protein